MLGGGGSREGGIGVESLIIGMGDEGHICFLSLILRSLVHLIYLTSGELPLHLNAVEHRQFHFSFQCSFFLF